MLSHVDPDQINLIWIYDAFSDPKESQFFPFVEDLVSEGICFAE